MSSLKFTLLFLSNHIFFFSQHFPSEILNERLKRINFSKVDSMQPGLPEHVGKCRAGLIRNSNCSIEKRCRQAAKN